MSSNHVPSVFKGRRSHEAMYAYCVERHWITDRSLTCLGGERMKRAQPVCT